MTVLIIILILIAVITALLGIIGAVVPNMPGPPLCFASMVAAYFACPGQITTELLLWMAGLTVLVTVIDYVAPILLTKIGGGSKYATWGSTIGIVAGLFFMPLGIIVGPLLGAFIGEMLHDFDFIRSVKVSAMSLISFLLGTGLKLIASLVMTYYAATAIWHSSLHRFGLANILQNTALADLLQIC